MKETGIDLETLGKIEQANLANIVKKVKSGKPLSVTERQLVAEKAASAASRTEEGRDYSVNALSKLLGHDRRTIDKAIVGVEPTRTEGKTKYYRLADVEAALNAKKSTLRDKKLLQEIRKLKRENDERDKLLVTRAKVAESITRCLTPASATLEQRLVNEYPTAVAGLDVPQARIYGKRLLDEVLEYFRAFEKEWTI